MQLGRYGQALHWLYTRPGRVHCGPKAAKKVSIKPVIGLLTLYSFSNHYNYRTKRAYLQANRRCDTGSMRGSDAINHPSSDHESNLSVSSPFFPN